MASYDATNRRGAQAASRGVGNDRSAALRRTAQLMRNPRQQTKPGETPGINPGRRSGKPPMKPQVEVLTPEPPAKPAWQQLREAGISGQGSAAANRAAAAKLPGSAVGGLAMGANGPVANVGGGGGGMGGMKPPMRDFIGGEGVSNVFPAPDPNDGEPSFMSGGGFMGEPTPTPPPRLRGFAPQGASPELLDAIRSAQAQVGGGSPSAPGVSLAQRLAGMAGPRPIVSDPLMPPEGPEMGYPPARAARAISGSGGGGMNHLRRRPGQLGASPEARGVNGYGGGMGL